MDSISGITSHHRNLTWWQIKHINYIHRIIIPTIITCLVQINNCSQCNRLIRNIHHHRIRIISRHRRNHSSSRRCHRKWMPLETITLDNRRHKRCEATRTDQRAMTATTQPTTIQMWVLSAIYTHFFFCNQTLSSSAEKSSAEKSVNKSAINFFQPVFAPKNVKVTSDSLVLIQSPFQLLHSCASLFYDDDRKKKEKYFLSHNIITFRCMACLFV